MTTSRGTKVRRSIGTGLAAAALATGAAALIPATAAAETVGVTATCAPGQVPLVLANTWVRSGPGLSASVLYQLDVGAGYRITAGPIDNDGIRWWKGNGNGLAEGWTPEYNLSCR